MDVLILLVFISLIFVAGAVLMFAVGVKNRDFDHFEELSLKPLEEDERAE